MTSAVQLESLEGLKRKLTIEMPWDDIDATVKTEVKKITSTARIDGFRPGKVPEKVIVQRYGTAIRQDAMQKIIDKKLKEEFEERKLSVVEITAVDLEQSEPSAPFKFSALFEVLPEINFKDLTGQVVQKRVATIEEKDIDEVLARLQKQYKEWIEVDTAAALEDKLVIDFVGYRDGEPFAGGKAEGAELILGSKQFIPGFEDSLVGMKSGEKRTINVTFPEAYHEPTLAGVATTFDVTVHKVLTGKMRELNEAFAELLGVKEGGLEALRAELRQGLERELAVALREENKKRVLAKLKEINHFEVPNALIQEEMQRMAQAIQAQAAKQKQNIQINDMSRFTEQARNNVIVGLLMREAMILFNLKVESSHITKLLEEKMSAYENPAQMMQLYYNSEELIEQIKGEAMEMLLIDALLDTAQIEEEHVSFEKAIHGAHDHDHHNHDHNHDHE
ncbi:MAG: trigger factor [Gammaproteobacteria bacterium]|jgi:trigger factor|nr:trigger factor [Gammaproteobacteria bacterium]